MIDTPASSIGRTESAADLVVPTSVAALAATLDDDAPPQPGEPLPPLWHWIFFRPVAPQSKIAEDAHPVKGGFLPDLDLPRRMWAGGRLRFLSPVKVGAPVVRDSRIADVARASRATCCIFVAALRRMARLSNCGPKTTKDG